MLASVFLLALLAPAVAPRSDRPPNVVLIFIDDQGYQDLGCFGSPDLQTPHIDRMAAEGMRFTDYYSAASVCTPSRAALMTGCYPERVGNLPVLFPHSDRGLNPEETTLAELLRSRGYATACFGKWHLGHHEPFLPTNQGFDEYFGIPYSNDMGIDPSMQLAENVVLRDGKTVGDFRAGDGGGPPLMRGTQVVEWPADQRTLTRRYTDEAIRFVRAHRDEPFFVYLPHTMPHVPLYVTDRFRGRSAQGLYGDSIEEIDHEVGRLLDALRETDLAEDTLVIYTSDNGPWHFKQNATDKVKGNMNRRTGGSALPLRGAKFSKWEGGMRVPAVWWWPGHIRAGTTSDAVVGSIDVLPTVAVFANAPLPSRPIDGHDIAPILLGRENAEPTRTVTFYRQVGVREGRWKLHKNELFDLAADIGESQNVAADHPDVAERLRGLLTTRDLEMREPGRFERPFRSLESLPGWQVAGGRWRLTDTVMRQNDNRRAATLRSPPLAENSLRIDVSARALRGKGAIRLFANATEKSDALTWTIRNGRHQVLVGDVKLTEGTEPAFEPKRWYRLSMLMEQGQVVCLVDGKPVLKAAYKGKQGRIGLGTDGLACEFSGLAVSSGDATVLRGF